MGRLWFGFEVRARGVVMVKGGFAQGRVSVRVRVRVRVRITIKVKVRVR